MLYNSLIVRVYPMALNSMWTKLPKVGDNETPLAARGSDCSCTRAAELSKDKNEEQTK